MLTGDVKKILIEILTELTKAHQEARAAVTDADVRHFMSVRPIDGGSVAEGGEPRPPATPAAV